MTYKRRTVALKISATLSDNMSVSNMNRCNPYGAIIYGAAMGVLVATM